MKMNKYNLEKWQTPDSYFGFDPVGDFVIYGRNRDSSILENSNYELILSQLVELSETLGTDNDEPFAYDYRASHWACGWVETILLRKNSPESLQALASEILSALGDYPVVDESDYSERQSLAVVEYWDNCSLGEKIEWCKDSGESIFFARHSIPESIQYSEMFY